MPQTKKSPIGRPDSFMRTLYENEKYVIRFYYMVNVSGDLFKRKLLLSTKELMW